VNFAAVGVGSNINPSANIRRARDILSEKQRIIKESSFIRTTPIGVTDQPDFLNGAWLIETEGDIDTLKMILVSVERLIGRKKTSDRFGPRVIDLDIIAWNGKIIHNDYYYRDFVRNAVHEILPSINSSTI
jgi:2-amino-4-hydroxy-6-hydroxymethyldihydropteridine diphosphokinase